MTTEWCFLPFYAATERAAARRVTSVGLQTPGVPSVGPGLVGRVSRPPEATRRFLLFRTAGSESALLFAFGRTWRIGANVLWAVNTVFHCSTPKEGWGGSERPPWGGLVPAVVVAHAASDHQD